MENTNTINPARIAVDAIKDKVLLEFTFKGTPKRAIPLVFGQITNGQLSLLCITLTTGADGRVIQGLRLYHFKHIDNLIRVDEQVEPEILWNGAAKRNFEFPHAKYGQA